MHALIIFYLSWRGLCPASGCVGHPAQKLQCLCHHRVFVDGPARGHGPTACHEIELRARSSGRLASSPGRGHSVATSCMALSRVAEAAEAKAPAEGRLWRVSRTTPLSHKQRERPTPPSLYKQDKASQILEKSCKDVSAVTAVTVTTLPCSDKISELSR